MPEVYEIYLFEYNEKEGTVYVEAEVEDAVQISPATQYEPEQWTHGRCATDILWDVEDEVFGPLSKEVLLKHLNESENDWMLIPFDISEEESSSAPMHFRTVFGYYN
jgi:hypothetical protein